MVDLGLVTQMDNSLEEGRYSPNMASVPCVDLSCCGAWPCVCYASLYGITSVGIVSSKALDPT